MNCVYVYVRFNSDAKEELGESMFRGEANRFSGYVGKRKEMKTN